MNLEEAKCYRFKKEDWFIIAVAIDPDFKSHIGTFEVTMPTKKFPKYVILSSVLCDSLPTVYVYTKNLQGIQEIRYEGEFTTGKQEIQPITYLKIDKALG